MTLKLDFSYKAQRKRGQVELGVLLGRVAVVIGKQLGGKLVGLADDACRSLYLGRGMRRHKLHAEARGTDRYRRELDQVCEQSRVEAQRRSDSSHSPRSQKRRHHRSWLPQHP